MDEAGNIEELKLQVIYQQMCEAMFFNYLSLCAFRMCVDAKPTEERTRIIDGLIGTWERTAIQIPFEPLDSKTAEEMRAKMTKRFRLMMEAKII